MRTPPLWLCAIFALLPFASLFMLPWGVTLVLMFMAGLVFPPLALVVGILADILYYSGEGWFTGVVWGLVLALLAFLVRYVVRTRIM